MNGKKIKQTNTKNDANVSIHQFDKKNIKKYNKVKNRLMTTAIENCFKNL